MKIFLADPHPQVRSALSLILSQIPEASVISEIEDIFQLLVLWSLVSGPDDEDCRVRRRELP